MYVAFIYVQPPCVVYLRDIVLTPALWINCFDVIFFLPCELQLQGQQCTEESSMGRVEIPLVASCYVIWRFQSHVITPQASI